MLNSVPAVEDRYRNRLSSGYGNTYYYEEKQMNKNGQSYDQYNSQQGQPNPDDMRYREPSFNQYCQDPAAPRSLQVFLMVSSKGLCIILI